MKKLVVALCLLIFIPSAVFAIGDQTGTVTQVVSRASDGLVYFMMSGTHNNKPPCALNDYWIIRDPNSTTGKSQLSMLMTAVVSGRTISVSGMGFCDKWPDGESLDAIYFK